MGCTLLSVLLNEPTKRPNRHDDWVVCLGLALVVTPRVAGVSAVFIASGALIACVGVLVAIPGGNPLDR